MSSRPFPLKLVWIQASPFKDKASVLRAEYNHKNNISIGFTALASLRSMGRIARTDGTYRIGAKYKALS